MTTDNGQESSPLEPPKQWPLSIIVILLMCLVIIISIKTMGQNNPVEIAAEDIIKTEIIDFPT